MKTEKDRAVLLLGSNLGDSFDTINKALTLIKRNAGKFIQKSSLYQTAPWGFTKQPDFLNLVVVIETSLPPIQLLKVLKTIEKELGRTTTEKWRERIIDIDILFYNELICESEELIIPHPLIDKRRFALEPLVEILPDLIHPVSKKAIKEILDECEDAGKAKKLNAHDLKL